MEKKLLLLVAERLDAKAREWSTSPSQARNDTAHVIEALAAEIRQAIQDFDEAQRIAEQ